MSGLFSDTPANRRQVLASIGGLAAAGVGGASRVLAQRRSGNETSDDERGDGADDESGGGEGRDETASGTAAWPSYMGGGRNRGYRPNASGPREGYAVRWRASPDGESREFACPVVGDDAVYAGATRLWAFDAADGSVRWSVAPETEGQRFLTPAVGDGVVYAGTGDADTADADGTGPRPGTLYALDAADGTERWRFSAPQSSDATATAGEFDYVTVGAGVVFAAKNNRLAVDDRLYALDPGSGEELWSVAFGRDGMRQATWAPPVAVADGTAFVKTDRGLFAFDAETGDQQWHVEGVRMRNASPAVAGGTVYASTDDGAFYALSAADGSVEWRFAPGGNGVQWSSPAVGPDAVYVAFFRAGASGDGVDRAGLYALSREDGSPRRLNGGYATKAALADDTLYLHNRAVDATDGAGLWEYAPNGEDPPSNPAVAGETVYLTGDGVVALEPGRNGAVTPTDAPPERDEGADEDGPVDGDDPADGGGSDERDDDASGSVGTPAEGETEPDGGQCEI